MFQSDLMLSSLGLHVMNGDERNLYVYCCWHFDSWDSLLVRVANVSYVGMSNCGALFFRLSCSSCIVSSRTHTDAHKSSYMHNVCACACASACVHI